MGYKNPGEMHLWMFDLISQTLAFSCTVTSEICDVGGPVCHQFLSISHLMFFLCVARGLSGLEAAVMSLCFRRVVWSCKLGLSLRGFSLGCGREGQGGGAALRCLVQRRLKHKSFTFLPWRLLRSSGICLFNLRPYVDKLLAFIVP